MTIDPLKIPEKFRKFIGDNHNCLDENTVMKGGSVHFGNHINNHLSDKLWEDLEFRLHATNIRIYTSSDLMWLDGPIQGSVRIILEGDYRIADIVFTPHITPKMVRIIDKNHKMEIVMKPDLNVTEPAEKLETP